MLQKRYIIAHNAGVADERYLDKTNDSTVRLNQTILIDKNELLDFLDQLKNATQAFLKQFQVLINDVINKNKAY